MNVSSLVKYILTKKGAIKDYPFGDQPLVLKVSGKVFALVDERGEPPSVSLKCDPVLAESLREQYAAVIPGYHLNKMHWNTVRLDGTVPDADLKAMVDHSYDAVVSKLKKADREALEMRLAPYPKDDDARGNK
ncbi:MmcQ/YjbR family DNA-binding protein [Cohnella sp. GCM10020058]|uniref:MmcQ/YjbR family DNA-binding protein n=1 Tax=Cohnella sp. GCM10020058 TaxID=3317330 RepID=UPI0036316992